MTDEIHHPTHYTTGSYETWDLIRDLGLSYEEGNIVKYLTRAGRKTKDPSKDLQKAAAYIDRACTLDSVNKLLAYCDCHELSPEIEDILAAVVSRDYTKASVLLSEYVARNASGSKA